MAASAYDRLSFLDHSFLLMETPTSPMHIAGAVTFDAGPLLTPSGGVDINQIRSYVASRLYLIPRYRQRLTHTPIGHHPVWIDDKHFNIDYHVRHVGLPKPGSERQLRRLAARIISQHLDRRKPLWEIWVLEGLVDPTQFVLIIKVHHCMVDGVSSVDLLTALLKPESTTLFDEPPHWVPRPRPSAWELSIDELARVARLPFDIMRQIPALFQADEPGDSGVNASVRALAKTLRSSAGAVSDTALNRRIGPHRRLDWLTMDLASVKAVKNRLGGTLNDVVLATVAGAVRRYLERRLAPLENLDFRVLAPVSVRTTAQRGTLGNQVSGWMVPMPLAEGDARARLGHIRATTERLKDSNQALSAKVLTQVGEWIPSTLLAAGARLAVRALPFNLVVTNVPGPQLPLYLLGARMIDNFGFLPLVDSLCLGIVLFSYDGKLCWGFTADWDEMPDLSDFIADIRASFDELCAIASETTTENTVVVKTSAKSRGRRVATERSARSSVARRAASGRQWMPRGAGLEV